MKSFRTRILIADDDPVYREVGREALELDGYAVTVAANGREAIEALARETFHAAVIDLTMPEADGIEVISRARRGGPNANTPMVVITGHDEAQAVERAYEAGATTFLTKPLNWLLFTHHMNFVLRAGRVETELREATQAAAFLGDLKSNMLGALAHEFQVPIKTIYGFAELIRREVYGPLAPASYREMALDMGNAAQKLNASFLKLLDLGNALTEQLEVKSEQFPLKETLNGIFTTAADQAERRNVLLVPQIEIPAEYGIDADRVLFIQAVRAIVSNAVRLAPRNSRVDIRAWIGDDGSFRLTASDTGPAISASVVAEIRRGPAQRPGAHLDTEARDVGLKIAKVLSEAHQGSLDVQTDHGGLNVVRLDFPATRLRRLPVSRGAPASPETSVQPGRLAEITAAVAQEARARAAQAATSVPALAPAKVQPAAAPTRVPRPRPHDLFDIIDERQP